MRERDGEKGSVPLHCLRYNKERFVYLSLSAELVYEKVQSRCLCGGDSPIVSPGVGLCMHIQYVCVCLCVSACKTCTNSPIQSQIFCKNTGAANHLKGHEISERLIFIIRSSLRKWLDIFCSCVQRQKPRAGT